MIYNIVSANNNDIDYLKEAKLFNIYSFAHNLKEEEIKKINNYVDNNIPKEINDYKIIKLNDKRIGCYLVIKKDDGVLLDEIFLDENYRNKGIGSSIISKIFKTNNIVYLWVYKDNIKAINLYKKLGFNVVKETEIRYYMKYSK